MPISTTHAFRQEQSRFYRDTGASNKCMVAVLSQMQMEKERVITYKSNSLSVSQWNYRTMAFAIQRCEKIFGSLVFEKGDE